MLEHIFGSKTRVKVLNLFFKDPKRKHFVREISRETKSQLNAVRREIENLAALGILVATTAPERVETVKEGNTKKKKSSELQDKQKKYYAVNIHFMLYQELRALMLKSQILVEKDFIKKIQNVSRLQLFVLSGVFVGRDDAQTDMLLVGNLEKKSLLGLIKRFERELGQHIRYTMMTPIEYRYRKDITDKFLYDIIENKKVVIIDRIHNDPSAETAKE